MANESTSQSFLHELVVAISSEQSNVGRTDDPFRMSLNAHYNDAFVMSVWDLASLIVELEPSDLDADVARRSFRRRIVVAVAQQRRSVSRLLPFGIHECCKGKRTVRESFVAALWLFAAAVASGGSTAEG